MDRFDIPLEDYQHIMLGLTKQLETNPEQLRDVLQYIIAIGSSLRLQMDVDTLLKMVAVAACKALRFRYSVLYLVDERGSFRVRATVGISVEDESYLQEHTLPGSIAALLINEDYRISDSYFIPAEAPIWLNSELASYFVIVNEDAPASVASSPASPGVWRDEDLLIVPLVSGDNELLGFLTPDAPLNGLRPTVEIMMLFELFANQAAVAIEGARLYADLRNALKKAQESERMKDHFMMIASHELRTPITAIQGYIELLGTYGDALDNATRTRFLQNARRACDELALLLGNVMDASRVDQDRMLLNFAPVQVAQSVELILEILEPILSKEQRSVSVDVPDKFVVWVDELRLRQILLNLVSNALKYTPAGTAIEIRAESVAWGELDQRLPSLPRQLLVSASDCFVVLGIRDWGAGIAHADQPRLFSRFMRLTEAINSTQRGAGLGLYLCRQLTEAMGGYIWLESDGIPGEGSTFFVALPLHESS